MKPSWDLTDILVFEEKKSTKSATFLNFSSLGSALAPTAYLLSGLKTWHKNTVGADLRMRDKQTDGPNKELNTTSYDFEVTFLESIWDVKAYLQIFKA